jgi:uncharacterized protein (DUF302 family)
VRRCAPLLLLVLAICPAAALADDIARFEARGSFDDVKDNLVAAIEGRGLVINATSRIGEMLERTGRDLGATRRVYERAEVLEFCSASLSRKAMEADPQQIAFCPYTIAIYSLPDAKGKVFLVYRHLPVERPAMVAVDKLLDSIVREAVK